MHFEGNVAGVVFIKRIFICARIEQLIDTIHDATLAGVVNPEDKSVKAIQILFARPRQILSSIASCLRDKTTVQYRTFL